MLGILLVPACLAVAAYGGLILLPRGPRRIHDMTDQLASSTYFTCFFRHEWGLDPPSELTSVLRWYDPNDQEITSEGGSLFITRESPTSVMLTFASLSEDQEGKYTCRGRVNDQEQEVSKELLIYKGIKVVSDNKQYIINGRDGRLTCRVEIAEDFMPYISWFKVKGEKDLKPINNDSKYQVIRPKTLNLDNPAYLEIRNVTLADQDLYMCTINNRLLGKSHYHRIEVIVTVPPSSIKVTALPMEPEEGERVELSCSAEGIPAPHYNFTKFYNASREGEEEVIVENSTTGHYVIENVKRGDEGLYQCTAFNQGGTENASAEINVRVTLGPSGRASSVQISATVLMVSMATASLRPWF